MISNGDGVNKVGGGLGSQENIYIPFRYLDDGTTQSIGICTFHINLVVGKASPVKTGIVAYAVYRTRTPGKHNFQTGENDPTVVKNVVTNLVVDCGRLNYLNQKNGFVNAADIPLAAGGRLGDKYPHLDKDRR